MQVGEILSGRPAKAGLAVVVVAGVLGWEFGIKPTLAKRQAYDGTILEKVKDWNWLSFGRRHSRGHRRWDYSWRIECSDGQEREIEVPYHLWRRAKQGDPIRKLEGERWPQIDTAQARQRQEDRQKVFDVMEGKTPAAANQADPKDGRW